MTNNKLDLRTEPKQLRARERVSAILDVTEKMLASGEKVTTSSIAKKAGIPVGSVYRYFPDLIAIYRQLFKNINGSMLDKVKFEFQNDDPSVGWQQTFDRCMEIIRNSYEANPALGGLLLLMEHPELQGTKRQLAAGIADALADRWRQGRDDFTGDDPGIVASKVIEMAVSNELSYFLEKDKNTRDRFYTEGAKAIEAYLKIYLKA